MTPKLCDFFHKQDAGKSPQLTVGNQNIIKCSGREYYIADENPQRHTDRWAIEVPSHLP